jgi:diguanylate cyclase (GGDEF)-like protein/putative nucleotidyltransferase with HDIG domain
MTTASAVVPAGHTRAPEPPSDRRRLSRSASTYLGLVFAVTAVVTGPFFKNLINGEPVDRWGTFLVLGAAAAVTQLFVVRVKATNRSYHTSVTFLVAAALLLPPELIVLMGIVQNVPEWLRERYAWYIQSFNICNYTLSTLAAWGAAQLVLRGDTTVAGQDIQVAAAGLAACAVFVAVNHLVLSGMLGFARGHSFRDTGLFSFESLSINLVLTAVGVATAAFWEWNPWLVPIAIAPLFVIHRSLSIPQLQAEARVDPKTGLYNARHFASALTDELARATRVGRPLALLMADLDLLRDINNTYGHLAGDAVLRGIAEIFRSQLRHYDVPARFGGEEFSILLPETTPEQAMEIAERIRRSVAQATFDVETSSEPIRATVSIGVAIFPSDGTDANELIHQADLAVYRAKLQGRNRVFGASSEPFLVERQAPLVAVPEDGPYVTPIPGPAKARPAHERRHPRPHAVIEGPHFLALSKRLGSMVGLVSFAGVSAGVLGLLFGASTDVLGLVAIVALVGVGQALALEVEDGTVISVSAVGALAGAAMLGSRAALALAVTTVVVEWSARRSALHRTLFNIGTLTLASLSASTVYWAASTFGIGELGKVAAGVVAGAAYFFVNMGLLSLALSMEGHARWWAVFRERFAWLLLHWLAYGFVGGVMAVAYHAAGLYALAVFAVPLLLMRKTQEAYISHTQRSAQKLREAAETIHSQNVSLEQANRLLKERSTAAMESLSATVDARDSYTAGHSRRVQQLALAIGRELGLSQAELEVLGHAALFHDIGKLAIPDAILLKPASLTSEEWALMQRHAEEGARIIDRLGFLGDAVPSIRHHHERWDGTGYPDRLRGEDIPLGARIIHVADALDSMLTTRIYRAARPPADAMAELRRATGSQFCPRSVGALERILPIESDEESTEVLAAAS